MSSKQKTSTVGNKLRVPARKSASNRKFTFAEMEELAERDDFGEILTAAGIPDTPIPEAREEKWDDLVEFDRSKFDDAAYKKYEEDFFKK
jgi:hypothetical protein